MKNLFKIGIAGCLLSLLSFSFLTVSGCSPGKADKGKHISTGGSPVVSMPVSTSSFAVVTETAFELPDQAVTYLKPVNDPKPDNTNYQLVRKESLKLHKAIRDC